MQVALPVKQSQRAWTVEQLKVRGAVSRNDALKNRITRLGAIICTLKSEGWNIEGGWQPTLYGRDYIYYLEGDDNEHLHDS